MANDALISRFLAWPLPKTVCSDLCVTDSKYGFPRSGTNLLTHDEAGAMLDHVLSGPKLTPEALQLLRDHAEAMDLTSGDDEDDEDRQLTAALVLLIECYEKTHGSIAR